MQWNNKLLYVSVMLVSLNLGNVLSVSAQAYTQIGPYRHYINVDQESPFEKYNVEHQQERYKKMQNFSEGLILIYLYGKGKYAYMDSRAFIVIPKQYEEYGFFSEGRALFKHRGKWGYLNSDMEEVVPAQFEEATFFKGGMAKVRKYGRTFYIDKNGNCMMDCR